MLDGVGGFVEEPCFYPYLSGRANLRLLAKLDGRRAAAGTRSTMRSSASTSPAARTTG